MQRLLSHAPNTLVDTLTLECRAYNAAFAESGLDWTWSDAEYNSLKLIAGERHRIVWYAEHSLGHPISCAKADMILWRKEQALYRLLQHGVTKPGPGMLRSLDEAASNHIPNREERTVTQRMAEYFPDDSQD